MIEQRSVQRHRVLKAGIVAFGRAGVTCLVRNLSPAGACLEQDRNSDPAAVIPDQFTLAIEKDRIIRRCHVVWRNDKRVGVAFD